MTRFCLRHPVSTWMAFSVFVVLALYAIPKLEIEAVPEVDLPSLTVTTRWTGASPKAIQRAITRPVEEAVRNVHGVESVKSTSRAGRSQVEVEFRRDVDLDFARLHLNEQLGSVRRGLPLNASQPRIEPFVPEEFQTEQFFTFSVASELSPNELREVAEDWIVPQVLSLEGVADAQVLGGARPLLELVLDRAKLELYGITADDVFGAVNSLDELQAAGAVRRTGLEWLVALRQPVDEAVIGGAVVARRGGRTYTLDMLGEVRPGFEDPSYFVRSDGRNVVQVQVNRRSGGNAVGVSRTLRAALPQIAERTPGDLTLTVDEDEGQDLEDKLEELVVRSGVILALLFVLLAVTLRQVQLTGTVIVSVLFALFICLSLFYFLELSVNFITISGLTICFGMLLDNSILVLEAIHRRLEVLRGHLRTGLGQRTQLKAAAETVVEGTGEVAFPILATTLTTMVAFGSFIFLTGRLALYYVPLAICIGLAMLASVFVAFGWLPVVLNQLWVPKVVRKGNGDDGGREVDDPDAVRALIADDVELDARPPLSERLFGLSQRLCLLIVPALVAAMFWGYTVYRDDVIKGGFWRMPDDDELFLYMRMPDGTDIRVASETMLKFEQSLLPLSQGAHMRATVFGNQGFVRIEFDDWLLRTGVPALYRELLQETANGVGGTSIFIRGFAESPYMKGNFGGSSMNSLVKLTGYNSKRLTEIAENAVRRASRSRRVRKARLTGAERFGRSTNEETVVALKRDALATYGVSVLDVVTHIRRLLGIDAPFTMLVDGAEERVRLKFGDADDLEFAALGAQVLKTRTGEQVRLTDLVSMETVPLSDAITRENQRYTQLVNWEYVGTDRMRRSYIKSVLGSMELPYGYHAEEATQQFLTEEEESNLALTVILAAGFIVLLLAALFESLTLPLLVLTSLPMALLGVVVTFWKTTTAFDSSAQIGLVLLFGIVVNNAILLVSRFRHEAELVLTARLGGDPGARAALFPGLRRQLGGSDLYALPRAERPALLRRAIARATRIRLRSILLTSGTTVVGLLPLLVQVDWVPWKPAWLLGLELPFTLLWSDGGSQDIWHNLALTSVGGLISSTVLIVLALPPLYYFCVRVGWVVRRFYRWGDGIVLGGSGGLRDAAGTPLSAAGR